MQIDPVGALIPPHQMPSSLSQKNHARENWQAIQKLAQDARVVPTEDQR